MRCNDTVRRVKVRQSEARSTELTDGLIDRMSEFCCASQQPPGGIQKKKVNLSRVVPVKTTFFYHPICVGFDVFSVNNREALRHLFSST